MSSETISIINGNSAFAKIASGIVVWILTLGSSFRTIGIAISWTTGSCGSLLLLTKTWEYFTLRKWIPGFISDEILKSIL